MSDSTTLLKILYVEDDKLIREATYALLKRFSAKVIMAQNGEEGLALYAEHAPNIIITDIRMPVVDGLTMARKIKEENPYIPIIFVSAHNDIEHLMDAIDLGADGFLVKPFAIKKLHAILEKFRHFIKKQEEAKTNQRLLEEYKKAVDASAILSIFDRCGNIIFANDHLCEVTGYTQDELISHPYLVLRHPDMPNDLFGDLWHAISRGKIWKGIVKNYKKNGDSYYVDTTVVPIHNEKDRIAHFLGIGYEITSLIEAQNNLQIALKRAEEADKTKGIFLANMSHEMRTPLNGIIGFGRLLQEYPLTPTQREYVEIINNSGEHLLGIINDILDISKIESGKFSLERLPMKTFDEVNAAIHICKVRALEKGVRLIYHLDSLKNLTLLGDAMRLKQVLISLLNNALKFTPPGGEVTLSAKILLENEKQVHVEFSVADTGIGISKEHLQKIFQPFEQAESSTARNYGGTGLGLSISCELVKLMGGEIKCTSEIGRGSRFFFTLLFAKTSLTPQNAPLSQEARFSGRVLVAEDHAINQKLIKIMLTNLGIDTLIVENGAEALKQYQESHFDLVLLDIQMPVMDGSEAHQKIRALQRQSGKITPILVLSANATGDDRLKYLQEGFDACLTKPLKNEELISTLSNYLPLSAREKSEPKEPQKSTQERRERMIAQLGIDMDTLLELEREFITHAKSNMEALLEELHKGHASSERAHAIKGAALNMGFLTLAEILAGIEQNAKEEKPINALIRDRLQEAWNYVKEEIKNDY